MKRQDILTILITFTFGLLSGGYLYVVGFAPQMEKVSDVIGTDEKTEYDQLTVVGTRYGGCSRAQSCDSFQVRGDGAYSYLPGDIITGAEPVTGNLPGYLTRELNSAVSLSVLTAAAVVKAPDTCDSYIDKNDYRYDITFDTIVYDVDTCGTDFSQSMPLGQTLDKIWNYFETLNGS